MRRFSRAGTRHFEPVQIVGGPLSRAIVQRPPDIDNPGAEWAYPSLTMRVRHDSLLKSGQVVRLAGGDHYLVADHSATADWRTHHLLHCDRQVEWTRRGKILHPVTEVEIDDEEQAVAGSPIWVMWEKVRREFMDLNIRIAQETHLVACGADVRVDDKLDGNRVIRVNRALGINIVELQG